MAAVSLKVDAVCCVGGSSGHEGGCSDPAVDAVPPTGSLNENVVPLQWIECPIRWMEYVMWDDSLPMKVHAVFHNWLSIPFCVPDCGCSAHAVDAVSQRQMQYVVMEDAVPMKLDAVILQLLQCPLQVP